VLVNALYVGKNDSGSWPLLVFPCCLFDPDAGAFGKIFDIQQFGDFLDRDFGMEDTDGIVVPGLFIFCEDTVPGP